MAVARPNVWPGSNIKAKWRSMIDGGNTGDRKVVESVEENSGGGDTVKVFISVRESTCDECKEELGRKA